MRRETPRDWFAHAHFIARAAPGVGNPIDLTVGEFEQHLRLAVDGHSSDADDGSGWMRRHVERTL